MTDSAEQHRSFDVRVELSELIDNDLEGFLDLIAARALGDLLMDISYKAVRLLDDGALLLEVTGDVSEELGTLAQVADGGRWELVSGPRIDDDAFLLFEQAFVSPAEARCAIRTRFEELAGKLELDPREREELASGDGIAVDQGGFEGEPLVVVQRPFLLSDRACRDCGEPIFYDSLSGAWLHAAVEGPERDGDHLAVEGPERDGD